ncbi:MAG: hypothetical protein AABX31_00500 [Nanoarchaeota archaeon]
MFFGTYLTGAFGPSQELYKVRNLEKRGKGSLEEVQQQIRKDTKAVIREQERAGLDFIIDPAFWQYDLFQSLENIPQIVRTRKHENWFDNNLFYRWRLSVDAPLPAATGWFEKDLPLDLLPKDGRFMVILPCPYSIITLCNVSGYQDKKSAVQDLAKLIRAEALHLVSLGAGRIQYDEPAIVQKQSLGSLEREDLKLLEAALDICGTIPGASTSLHTYFGNAGPILPFLDDLPVDCLGIDCRKTNLSSVLQQDFSGKQLALGLIDARNTDPEEPEELVVQLQKVAEQCHPTKLWLTPTTGTETIGYTPGLKKIEILKETKRLFYEKNPK